MSSEYFRNIPKLLKSIIQVWPPARWIHLTDRSLTGALCIPVSAENFIQTSQIPQHPWRWIVRHLLGTFLSPFFALEKSWQSWAVCTGSKKAFLCDQASLFDNRSMLGLNLWMQQRNKKLQHVVNELHTLRNFFLSDLNSMEAAIAWSHLPK